MDAASGDQGNEPRRWGVEVRELENLVRMLSDTRANLVVPELRLIKELLASLGRQDPIYEPPGIAKEVNGRLRQLLRIGKAVAAAPEVQTPAQITELATMVESARKWFVSDVDPFIRRSDPEAAAAALADVEAKRKEIDAAAVEAKAALATIRGKAGEKAALSLAGYFGTQATKHEKAANLSLWLTAGALTALLAAVGAFSLVWPIGPTNDWINLAREGLPRLFVLGVFAYGVRFVVRNYTINKHLQVTNELRANILCTYPALVASMSDDDKKGRIAILLAQAAVTSTEGGYLHFPEDKGLEAVAVLEGLLRARA